MESIKTVTLEFLRPGPPHNQLLSPLTQYLALSGKNEAVTVRVPYEHQQFLAKLKYMQYRDGQDPDKVQALEEVAREISKILGDIPGLNADIATENHNELVHLRVILSASELSLLPFEMSLSPSGFPGQGRGFSTQLDRPIVITREIRNAKGFQADWIAKPKILFIAAQPDAAGSIPFRSHLLALRKAIDPWVELKSDDVPESKHLEDHLVVLPNANLQQIHQACSKHHFTHVHILAHGHKLTHSPDRFGIALHHTDNPSQMDVVSGQRLVAALRCHVDAYPSRLSRPNIVTIASCDSGFQGDVISFGGSLAHELHAEGIPMVVASQFPLTKAGSVIFVDHFYRKALWGRDPRVLLHEVRQSLRKQHETIHDWASLIAFVSLPENFAHQLKQLRTQQADKAVRTMLKIAHQRTEDLTDHGAAELDKTTTDNLLDKLMAVKAKATQHIPEANPETDLPLRETIRHNQDILSRLASAEKRAAQLCHSYLRTLRKDDQAKGGFGDKIIEYEKRMERFTKKAIAYYQRAYETKKDNHWCGLQAMSLTMVNQRNQLGKFSIPVDQWLRLVHVAQDQLETSDWAYGSLAELQILGSLVQHDLWPRDLGDWKTSLEMLMNKMGRHSYHCATTRLQLRRYATNNFMYLNEEIAERAEEAVSFMG